MDIFHEFKAYKYAPNRWRSILVNMNEHLRVGVWSVVTARRPYSHVPISSERTDKACPIVAVNFIFALKKIRFFFQAKKYW